MSAAELVCAKCGKAGGLSEEVEVESTGHRSVRVTIVDGEQKVERGHIEDAGMFGQDVTGTGPVTCSHCRATFDSIEEATAQLAYEYRCGECGWWGVQDWLHGVEHPDCAGELSRDEIAPLAQEALVA